ncbi:MAG: glycosyltransferase family 4 protein [Bacteroidota bacterium]|nr:glycosyltransferase family 4 protein [Bacteroidota bacterium]
MRILFLHCTYKYKGGEDTVVDEEVKLLKGAGHAVELLLFSNIRFELIKVLLLPFNLVSYIKTRRAIKKFRPQIVHIHNLHFAASPSVIYAIKNSKTPFVTTLHNFRLLCPSATLFYAGKLFLDSLYQSFPWTAIKNGVYKDSKVLTFWLALSNKLHKMLGTWRLCNRYLVLTNYTKDILLASDLKFRQEQLTVKPNFCSINDSINLQKKAHFLYVGRLTLEKGILVLLKTFSNLEYDIKIAGDGPLKDEVLKYSKQFSNIHYLGSLSKKDVFYELQTCSALIFPSIWLEGMPLIIIEAFATATPVIATKLGAMDSMICDNFNGFLFPPESIDGLSTQVKRWAAMSEAQKAGIRANAKITYNNSYSPVSNRNQLTSIYNSVILNYDK